MNSNKFGSVNEAVDKAKAEQAAKNEAAYKKPLDDKQAAIVEYQSRLISLGIWRSCLGCANWREQPMSNRTMVCGLFNQTPPAEIIVNGCRDYDQDIPF